MTLVDSVNTPKLGPPSPPVPTEPALPADRQPAAVYLARLAPGSRRTMAQALTTVANILTGGGTRPDCLSWHRLAYQHTAAVRATLAARYAPATANKIIAALRGTLRECWRLGLMTAEQYERAADLAPVKGETLPPGRALSGEELQILFGACAADPTLAGSRDAALLAILYGAGLRRSEVAALDLADYDAETGQVIVRAGKGHKERTGYLSSGARQAVNDWLRQRGDAPGPLLWPVNKGGHAANRKLGGETVALILQRRQTEAGLDAFTPHDMRRTFIGDLLDAGADLATVQRLAGHSSPQTTSRYDRRGEAAKQKAAALLKVPYAGRDSSTEPVDNP